MAASGLKLGARADINDGSFAEMKMRILMCVALLASSFAVQAEEAKDLSCLAQSEIVTKTVEMRKRGTGERRAKRLLAKDEEISEQFQPAIPLLVGWVYTLSKEDLKREPGASYLAACLEQ